jgi:hypothetical protein
MKTWEYHGIPRFTTQDVGRNPASLQNVVFDGLCVPNVAEHPLTYLRVAPILSNIFKSYPTISLFFQVPCPLQYLFPNGLQTHLETTWGGLQCPSFKVKTAFTAKRCQGIACGDSWQDAMLTVCYRSSSGTAKNLFFS